MLLFRQALIFRLLSSFLFSLIFLIFCVPLNIKHPRVFEIASGWSIGSIANAMSHEGLWQHSRIVKGTFWLASFLGPIQSGEFQLTPGITLGGLAYQCIEGKRLQHHVTLVPGTTLQQMGVVLANTAALKHSTLASTEKMIAKASFAEKEDANQSLEGQIYPDTYAFVKGDTDISILKRAHTQWQKRSAELWERYGKESPYQSMYEAAVAASLIEKEASLVDEQRLISGVIANRLRLHMPLQIDASVIYGLGDQYHGILTHEMMRIESPYNTYMHRALPPTPIASFSEDAFLAALQPIKHDYLFYVLGNNHRHFFSKDFKSHKANIKVIASIVDKTAYPMDGATHIQKEKQ